MARFNDDDLIDDDNDGEEFAGYTVVDENEDFRRKLAADMVESETTIASPLPENETKVIVDNASFFGVKEGDTLTLKITENMGVVFFGARKVATLKTAYVPRLMETRGGQWLKVTFYSTTPPMIKLEFSTEKTDTYTYQIPLPTPAPAPMV